MEIQPDLFAGANTQKKPVFNPDGISVKGCTIIYAPKGQAGEYSALAANPYRGCGHKCAYCYVPNVLQMPRAEFDAGAIPRPDFLNFLKKDAVKYQALGSQEQVLFSFTTDVYNPFHCSLTRPSLKIIQEHGMAFCVLTKGGMRALADEDLYRPERDAFATTLTTLNNELSLRWEPRAALPGSRIDALRRFHSNGIFTWVSLEPTLSVGTSLEIVKQTHEFVDLFKIGRANYMPITKTTDWKGYTLEMLELVNQLGVKHYFKHDLQPFLPAGYPNLQRIPQHN